MGDPRRLYGTKLGQETYFASWYLLLLFVLNGFGELGYTGTWNTVGLWIAALALLLAPMWYILTGDRTNAAFEQRSFVALGTQFAIGSVALLVGAMVLSPAVTVVEWILAATLLIGGVCFVFAGSSRRADTLSWRRLAAVGYGSIGAGLLVAWWGVGLVGPNTVALFGITGIAAAGANWWIAAEIARDTGRYEIEPHDRNQQPASPINDATA